MGGLLSIWLPKRTMSAVSGKIPSKEKRTGAQDKSYLYFELDCDGQNL
jgi:hypothetical protein